MLETKKPLLLLIIVVGVPLGFLGIARGEKGLSIISVTIGEKGK